MSNRTGRNLGPTAAALINERRQDHRQQEAAAAAQAAQQAVMAAPPLMELHAGQLAVLHGDTPDGQAVVTVRIKTPLAQCDVSLTVPDGVAEFVKLLQGGAPKIDVVHSLDGLSQ